MREPLARTTRVVAATSSSHEFGHNGDPRKAWAARDSYCAAASANAPTIEVGHQQSGRAHGDQHNCGVSSAGLL